MGVGRVGMARVGEREVIVGGETENGGGDGGCRVGYVTVVYGSEHEEGKLSCKLGGFVFLR